MRTQLVQRFNYTTCFRCKGSIFQKTRKKEGNSFVSFSDFNGQAVVGKLDVIRELGVHDAVHTGTVAHMYEIQRI